MRRRREVGAACAAILDRALEASGGSSGKRPSGPVVCRRRRGRGDGVSIAVFSACGTLVFCPSVLVASVQLERIPTILGSAPFARK